MLREELREIEGVTLHCQDNLDNHIGILSFNVEGLEALVTGTMLDVDYSITCRTGLHCAPLVHKQIGTDKIHGSVRFGLGPFNGAEDIDAATKAVGEIARIRQKQKAC